MKTKIKLPPLDPSLVYLGKGPLKGHKKHFATHVFNERRGRQGADKEWKEGKWIPASTIVHYAAPIGSPLAKLNPTAPNQ